MELIAPSVSLPAQHVGSAPICSAHWIHLLSYSSLLASSVLGPRGRVWKPTLGPREQPIYPGEEGGDGASGPITRRGNWLFYSYRVAWQLFELL